MPVLARRVICGSIAWQRISFMPSRRVVERGKPLHAVSNLAIECALILKSIYCLSLRAAQGFLSSVLELMAFAVPCRLPLLLNAFSRYDEKHSMEKEKYDPYYRDFPSNVVPVRTPFTRPGQHDAGHVFIYMTNKWKQWSLLLDKTCIDGIYNEARQYVPSGFSQFWLLEKRHSTHKLRVLPFGSRAWRNAQLDQSDFPAELDRQVGSGRPLVVLREPARYYTQQGDVLSYHLQEAEAVAAAETYTRRHNHRAVVGLLLWDEMWL